MKKLLPLIIALAINTLCFAQSFVIQPNGYSSDPRFLKIIKDRKYRLVGLYDTITTRPLTLYAKVLKGTQWIALDQKGKEIIPYPEQDVSGRPYEDDNGEPDYQELLFAYKKPFDILEENGK